MVAAERHTSRSQHHIIETKGLDQECCVLADRRKIRRVLENLLSNAVKYSPGEQKKVIVELQHQPKQAVLSVEDEGLGLSEEQIAKLLGQGGRVEEHARLGIEGTGIGLGSVKLILRAHGGDLKVTSQVGRGSRFSAVLPLE